MAGAIALDSGRTSHYEGCGSDAGQHSLIMFQFKFTSEASDDLHQLRKFDQVKIVQAIRSQLTDQPNQPTHNRKRLRPNLLAEWELRVEIYRVFYDVDLITSQVNIIAIGRKQGSKLLVHGQEYKL